MSYTINSLNTSFRFAGRNHKAPIPHPSSIRFTQPKFCGFDRNIRDGHQALQAFLDEFGGQPRSHTRILAGLESGDIKDLIKAITSLREHCPKAFDIVTKNDPGAPPKKSTIETRKAARQYLRELPIHIRKYNIANCSECSFITATYLRRRGHPEAQVVSLWGFDKNTKKQIASLQHTFVVIGLQPKAEINDIQTWGKDAVVVDSWLQKTLSPEEAMREYHDLLQIDLTQHLIELDSWLNYCIET